MDGDLAINKFGRGLVASDMHPASIGRRTWLRNTVVATTITALIAAIGLLAPGGARATDCSPVHRQVEGQDTENWFFLGYRATVLVNDFGDPQCNTNRSIFLLSNNNNWVELGWTEVDGPPHVVYWNRTSDGETHPHVTGHTPSGGTNQNFKIENQDGDHNWRVLYNGDPVDGSPGYVSNSNMDFALNNSEKHGASDDLYAHYDDQAICLTINQCNYGSPGNFHAGGNTTGDPPGYVWCKDSDREQHVRKNNCS